MMTTARTWLPVLIAAATACGCAHTEGPFAPPRQEVTVRGLLAPGAECPILETSDGHRYSIAGSLGSFKVGDRVCIRGRVAETSICMAGNATLAVESIDNESSCR